MLARNAEGLYWLGRYVERTSHLCRLMREQMETLVDRPVREINFGWRRIYGALRRRPPGPAIGFGGFDDDFTLADSFALADDLTFERSNPDSVWSCFAAARENARQMRQCITGDMWASLNLPYLRLRDLRIKDIWKTPPEGFYAEVSRDLDTFMGVVEADHLPRRSLALPADRPVRRAPAARRLAAAGPHGRSHRGGGQLQPRLDEPAAASATRWMPTRIDMGSRSAWTGCSSCWWSIRGCRGRCTTRPTRRPASWPRWRRGRGRRARRRAWSALMIRTVRGRWPSEPLVLEERCERLRQLEAQCRGFHDAVMATHVRYKIDAPAP